MEKETKAWQRRLLGFFETLLRGIGWLIEEIGITIRLFGFSPMFWELALAVFFLLVYLFPGKDTKQVIAFLGTELALPFVLGMIYSALNLIWVATQKRDGLWRYALIKASLFPAILDYLIFAVRPFQRFIGWGDPATTWRFCVFLVWGVVLANTLAVQFKVRTTSQE